MGCRHTLFGSPPPRSGVTFEILAHVAVCEGSPKLAGPAQHLPVSLAQALKSVAGAHTKLVIHARGKHKHMNASWELVHDRRALACRKLILELSFAAVSASPTFSNSSAKVCTGSAHHGLISPLKSDVAPWISRRSPHWFRTDFPFLLLLHAAFSQQCLEHLLNVRGAMMGASTCKAGP